ncbi:MAG: CHAT domain-containing protein [Chlorobi bacterium]|nr:CHAT domain-containing protein [Chlorobiota bacterium]
MAYYRKVVNIENESDRGVSILTCFNMSLTNYYLGDTTKAITWVKKARKLARQLDTDPFGFLYRAQNLLGFIYLGRHQPEKALPLFFQALKGYKELYGEHHPKIAIVNTNIASCYEIKNQPDSALYFIQQAIISNLSGFTDTVIYTNPRHLNALDRDQLLGDLWKKARLLAGRSDTQKDITASTQTWHLASTLIDTIRMSFRDEKSRLFYTSQVQQFYDDAITRMARFYALTSDPAYMEAAFEYSDKAKAANLLSALRTRKAMVFSHLPDSLQIQEQQWTEQIGTLHEMLYTEKNYPEPDPRKVDMLEEGIFRLSIKLDSLVGIMEKYYPTYYNLKYNTGVIPAAAVRKKLSPRQALLSYHLTENHLFSFCITNKQMLFTDQPVGSSFSVSIRNLAESFTRKNTLEYIPENMDTTLRYLGRILIRPFDSILGNKSLLIIPDGILLKVPFDLLLTDTGNVSLLPNRNTPPYLIFRQPVYYDYSATLHFEKGLDRKNLITRILAIAPGYPPNGLHLKNLSVIRQANDLILNPLPYAREEIKYVRKFTPGTTVTGNEATEEYFKRHASRYDILHLTMHTILNDKNPLYSKLVFSQVPDTLEDGLLNTWEIYGLSLKAKMAVLSACNTGSGRIRQGEGMMSLARGFKYAGVPTLVTTRWEVEDKASAELMELFYRNLRRGLPADVALQNAKITFLAHTDPLRLDPYYWAGYSLIGRPQRMFHPWKPAVMIILVVVSFILSGTYLRKKQKNLQDNRLKDGS